MKHYFQYGSTIRSLEATQVMASTLGIGPFVGFCRADISQEDNQIIIHSKPTDTTNLTYYEDLSKIVSRYINRVYDNLTSDTKFGLIARDGSIHIEDYEDTITIDINGEPTHGINQVIVFAIHQPSSQPIESPVRFKAVWSTIDFYNLYKFSMDWYNQSGGIQPEQSIVDIDPYRYSSLNFKALEDKVIESYPDYIDNIKSWNIVGIYGTSVDVSTQGSKPFSIVPYFSKWPVELTYNTAIHTLLIGALDRLDTITINQAKEQLGKVEMYAGPNLPSNKYLSCEGQELSILEYNDLYQVLRDTYNKGYNPILDTTYTTRTGYFRLPDLRSMFIVGFNTNEPDYNVLGSHGGEKEVTLTKEQMPQHNHEVYDIVSTDGGSGVVEELGFFQGSTYGRDLWRKNPRLTVVGNSEAHENRPPFYVLKYIMRVSV